MGIGAIDKKAQSYPSSLIAMLIAAMGSMPQKISLRRVVKVIQERKLAWRSAVAVAMGYLTKRKAMVSVSASQGPSRIKKCDQELSQIMKWS